MDAFLNRFMALPAGYRHVIYNGQKYGMRVEISEDGKRRKLYAEQLGGTDHISFNLYLLKDKPLMKPCEMPVQKVVDFVLGFEAV